MRQFKPASRLGYAIRCLIASAIFTSSAQVTHARGTPGEFDFYSLSLSWSPQFCEGKSNTGQCVSGKQLGFVLHGLWPSYDISYPQFCGDTTFSKALERQYASMFASPKLIGHEWQKHGTCSGLSPDVYFQLTERLKQHLNIPSEYQSPQQAIRSSVSEFKLAWQRNNKNLPLDAIVPMCRDGGRFLSDVMICYNKQANGFQACSNELLKRSAKSCGQASFLMRAVK